MIISSVQIVALNVCNLQSIYQKILKAVLVKFCARSEILRATEKVELLSTLLLHDFGDLDFVARFNALRAKFRIVENRLKEHSISSSTIAPGNSDHKNVQYRKKYKSTKLPNEPIFIARSQVSLRLQKKTHAFPRERDKLPSAERLEFSQPFLSFKQFKISSKCAIRKLIFLVCVCCNDFITENIPALRDLFQFIKILHFMHTLLRGGVVRVSRG